MVLYLLPMWNVGTRSHKRRTLPTLFQMPLRVSPLFRPNFLGAAPEAKSSLSAADKALGHTPKASHSASLKESSMVAEAFRSAQAKARGDGDAPLPGTVPAIPNALSVGTFVNQQSHLRR